MGPQRLAKPHAFAFSSSFEPQPPHPSHTFTLSCHTTLSTSLQVIDKLHDDISSFNPELEMLSGD